MKLATSRRPWTRVVFVAVAWLVAIAAAAGLLFAASAGTAFTADDANFSLIFIALALAVATDASVGAVLVLRRPGNVVGLVLIVAAILVGVAFLGFMGGAAFTADRGRHDLLAGLVSLLGGIGIYPSLIVAGPLVALVFPDGRLPGPRWRWPLGAVAALVALGSAIVVARPGSLGASLADNPLGVAGFSGSEAFWAIGETFGALALLFALLLALAGVMVRFRRAAGVERAQMKWFVAASIATGALTTITVADGSTQTIVDLISPWLLSLPPVAVGIAILRYRLYEIDRLISRTVSWAIVTGLLVVTFAAAVVALQAMLAGVTQGQTIAVAGSTLVAFALFQPLRGRVQSVVDQRFDRAGYDTQRTIEGFVARLGDQFDLERVGIELGSVVGRTLAPTAVTVWLRPSMRVRTR